VCSDLTRQHQLEQQLLQAQKMELMGRMTSSIAHDFNNLLTGILGFAALAHDRVGVDRGTRSDVEHVLSAATRAASLTQRLLAFSRSRSSRVERFPVDATLQQLEPLLRRLLSERHELELVSGAEGAWVKLDATQFEQVILNLVVNARDAMPRGGRIRIETEHVPEGRMGHHGAALGFTVPGVSIHVHDTGEGMDDATRERIFEPFFTTKDAGRGTGLGLSTVLAIVQDGGGSIGVQSTPDVGTCFTVLLPEVEAGVLIAPAAITAPQATGRGERILIVEDEPLVREVHPGRPGALRVSRRGRGVR
jgi:signal transduction histidine kinase